MTRDLSDADPNVSAGELTARLSEAARDWPVKIRIAGGEEPIELGLEIEDIHFERGKVLLITGSAAVIYMPPAQMPMVEGGENGR